uniref:NADH-ubiquinone oxidoreductase chain 2 n=1 Tax=Linguatula serrata TaxID=646052 RepID=A0A385UKP3_9CRUS|nr:NADH dehydrogenase subunit 2 [Linguatula serrata]AYB71154.1 NADH dehydrogenase subunit 2 [Linguatula serrata]
MSSIYCIYHTIFLPLLISSTIITLSSSSCLVMCLGLEINLITFLPILSFPESQFFSQSSMKYFLVQSSSSILLLFLLIFFSPLPSSSSFLYPLIFLIMILKSGTIPLHSCFISISNNISCPSLTLLLTCQKLAPIFILSLLDVPFFLLFLAMTNSILGAISGLTTQMTRLILAYSSLSHMGCILSSMPFSSTGCIFYFIIYSLNTTLCLILFSHTNSFSLNLPSLNTKTKILKLITLLNLAGLPPLSGFTIKCFTLNLIPTNFFMLSMTLISSSAMTLIFYLKLSFSSLFSSFPSNKPISPDSSPLTYLFFPLFILPTLIYF